MHDRKASKSSGHRRHRSSTPSAIHKKAGPDPDSQRRRAKKQQQNQIRKRKLAMRVLKAKRERWAEVALETQRIVLGDGKYVEERHIPVDPLEITVTDQGNDSSAIPNPIKTVGVVRDISMEIQLCRQGTAFYPHYCELLAKWAGPARPWSEPLPKTVIEFAHCSTLAAARQLYYSSPHLRTQSSTTLEKTALGVLSFASPKKPGGGYIHGGDEQEEVLARSSSLVASLSSSEAMQFYKTHKKYWSEDGSGLHDHSMVYSPGVVVFRKEDDDVDADHEDAKPLSGRLNKVSSSSATSDTGTFIPPFLVNVISAVPVNAAAVRSKHLITASDAQFFEDGIRHSMKERMARILRCFEERGDKAIVLGAFGCGSSENKVEVIADIWAELLMTGESGVGDEEKGKKARFADVFEKVVFAVPGKWYETFKQAFEMRFLEQELDKATME